MTHHQPDIDRTFRALADPTRRAVLARLARGAASVKELAEPFGMALPSFMAHLKLLEDSGLMVSEKRGRVRLCRFDPAPVRAAEHWLAEQRRLWETRLDQLDGYLLTLQNGDPDERDQP
ncbi:transcriptional regulator [Azospirillum cavernae]|uniref:Transcriptional regulator n=1 Tax=Azospirillum cavernae TaxID=2320860 RepID=A0A418VYA7_9PROT|nr:metalloregulator ArsR/SmtB family transcription factor [Azospirillum cavernae]RJF82084.1 transcriptional regulator [Azospirillum cavernae]